MNARQRPRIICSLLIITATGSLAIAQSTTTAAKDTDTQPASTDPDPEDPESSGSKSQLRILPQQITLDTVPDAITDALNIYEDRGFAFHVFFNNHYQAVVKNGLDTNGGRNAASLDAFLTFDLEQLGLIDEADALIHLQTNWGAGINDRTGSNLEVNDDAAGDLGFHIAQAWYRHYFFDHKLAVKIGFIDHQVTIDRNRFANAEDIQFMNQALDNNPLVPLAVGLGTSVTIAPTDWTTLTLGVGDAQSVLYKPGFSTAFHDENQWFAYIEQAFHLRFESRKGPLEGNYRFGMVYDPRPRPIFTDQRNVESDDDYGFYLSFDQMLYRESRDDDQGLGVFARFAYRTPEQNQFYHFWSAGFQYLGPIPGRDRDRLGFGFLAQYPSVNFREFVDPDIDEEVIYELYYAIQATDHIVVTLDAQYIDNPAGQSDPTNTITAGVRVRFAL